MKSMSQNTSLVYAQETNSQGLDFPHSCEQFTERGGLQRHIREEVVESDRQNDKEARLAGFRVVHVSNEAVLTYIEGVRQMIEETNEEHEECEEPTPDPIDVNLRINFWISQFSHF